MENNHKITILVVEDEKDIRDLLVLNLQKKGFVVDSVSNGESALQMIKENHYNLILLDLMIPKIDGMELTKILKNDQNLYKIPILMLTAKVEENDIIEGLEIGADDYLTKPFSLKVLMARIDKILRLRNEFEKEVISFDDFSINFKTRDVLIDNKFIELTFSEFEILKLLASNPNWVYSRSNIINEIKGQDYIVTDRTIDFQIVGLRKKMGSKSKYIKTIRGIGYKFVKPE